MILSCEQCEVLLTSERAFNRSGQSATKIDIASSVAAKTTRKLIFVAHFLSEMASLHRLTCVQPTQSPTVSNNPKIPTYWFCSVQHKPKYSSRFLPNCLSPTSLLPRQSIWPPFPNFPLSLPALMVIHHSTFCALRYKCRGPNDLTDLIKLPASFFSPTVNQLIKQLMSTILASQIVFRSFLLACSITSFRVETTFEGASGSPSRPISPKTFTFARLLTLAQFCGRV